MTRPLRYLAQMLVFLLIVGGLVYGLRHMLCHAFWANPGLNGFILAVLGLGILWNFRLLLRLWPEIRWLELQRSPRLGLSSPPPPRLLAPIASFFLQRRNNRNFILPHQIANTLLDSLQGRLDEGRDISRYVTQLLVFLGLLGTFYGLLLTVRSIADVIGGMSSGGEDFVGMFDHIKNGLVQPLNGMATAFSGSMFGLAGSLILGFLDLTTSQAQNRFFNEMEETLLNLTQLDNRIDNIAEGKETGTSNNASLAEGAGSALDAGLIQQLLRLNRETLLLLQENRNALREISTQSTSSLEQISRTLAALPHGTLIDEHPYDSGHTTAILQRIERQIAGLRDDFRHLPSGATPSSGERN